MPLAFAPPLATLPRRSGNLATFRWQGCQRKAAATGNQTKIDTHTATPKSCIAYVQQIVKENSEQHDAPNSLSADTLREIGAKNPPPPAWFESPEENLF